MATYETHFKPKGVIHEVTANEVSSGIADITFFANPQNTDELGYVTQVRTDSGVIKSDGINIDYRNTSGVVRVSNGTTDLATGDVVTVMGMSYV